MPLSDAAKNRHKNALFWRNLWTGLAFVLGIAVVSFISVMVVFLIRGSFTEGALSGFASLLGGGGFAWILGRRAEAARDEEEAFKALENSSKAKNRRDKEKQTRTAFLGRKNTE